LREINFINLFCFSLSLRRERAGVRVDNDALPTSILPSILRSRATAEDERKGGGGFGRCPGFNSRGISVLFLVIAMMLMVSIGYVLSYLIPTKQKSVIFPIQSNQAFYIAQSGVEYAVRYASDRGWRGVSDGSPSRFDLDRLNDAPNNQRNLGSGSFTINYATNTLTSTGQITGSSASRVVSVSNFSQFSRLTFDPASPVPCWTLVRRRARFYIKNVRNDPVTLRSFSASWTQTGPVRRIRNIYFDGVQKYLGNYFNGNPPVNFNRGGNSQTLNLNDVDTVLIYWNLAMTTCRNVNINFFTGNLGAGERYTFNLDSAGDGLPNC